MDQYLTVRFNSIEYGYGEVPINVHNVGVMFPQLLGTKDYYQSIVAEHEFQDLTLSNKPGTAFRKGIYLTHVRERENGDVAFNLLRCSTNLSGPTDNFRATDEEILTRVNQTRRYFFDDGAPFNHVLAQTYHNSATDDGKQKKARISEHSDKTKDMPRNGLMAFCTFYSGYNGNGFDGIEGLTKIGYDYVYGKGTTVLTKLRFRLKEAAAALDPTLTKQFDVTLYPNSVFMMDLRTNRLYTHEIVPSSLPVDRIPTRMGYVIRCSDTPAMHRDGQTFIVEHDRNVALQPITEATNLQELKELYFRENTTIEEVSYKNKFYFSMNNGDYLKPLV